MNFTFADAAQKMYLGHLKNGCTEQEFREACMKLLKYRRECHAKRKEALFQAQLKSIMEKE